MRGRQNRLGHLPSLLMRESVSPARQSWKPFSASLRPHPHESRTATLCDEFVVLVIGAVMKLDDSRLPRTSVVACSVSPSNTGWGNFTSLIPRLAIVVPTVRSLTDMPIISPSVNSEFING